MWDYSSNYRRGTESPKPDQGSGLSCCKESWKDVSRWVDTWSFCDRVQVQEKNSRSTGGITKVERLAGTAS